LRSNYLTKDIRAICGDRHSAKTRMSLRSSGLRFFPHGAGFRPSWGGKNSATSMLGVVGTASSMLRSCRQNACGQLMQWYVIFISVAATGAFGWFALELVGRPVRRFFDLRRAVRHQMLSLANVATPQPRETCVTSEQIRQYDRDLKNAREAQRILRSLSSQMLGFAESERAACIAIRPFGFDPSAAGSGLIRLANALDRHGTDRARFHKSVETTLRFG
jgi:hypothetical protein